MPIQILRTAIENEHPLVSRLIVFSDPTGSQEPDVGSGEAGRSLGPVSAAVVRVALAKREGPGGPAPLRTPRPFLNAGAYGIARDPADAADLARRFLPGGPRG